ncbi:hypothetical protein QFZ63_004579 [Streptomyces sp. B3I7]|jgi:hypothetical protein|uniref:hypothetical protein n=1 Tax=unclassified Streptomyces TaxID=2593676 RepID=UPI00278465AC|nr:MULTISPECIES: hypothetical protein [unclassified Streptomyces]MDQ0787571.1 hypothetical protein [Streptomyces sp. B3I8]MDQ0812865.1 hypothetical protein [Streptomyces sp. B3I7]
MKIESVIVVEHRSSALQPGLVMGTDSGAFGVVVPGASSCCAGCTSSSCGAVVRPTA